MKYTKLIRVLALAVREFSAMVSMSGGGVFVFLMTLLISVDVLGRAVRKPTYVAIEMSGYLLVGIVFLGLAYTQRRGQHISIVMLTDKLPLEKRRALKIATLILSAIFIIWLTWFTFGPVLQNYRLKAISLTLVHTPLWIPYAFIPLGLGMLAIELISEIIEEIRCRKVTRETEVRQRQDRLNQK